MTERDYERMLDAVQDAISPQFRDVLWSDDSDAPRAANDNDEEWPLTPFPQGWHAAP